MLKRHAATLLLLPILLNGCIWSRNVAVVGSGRLLRAEEAFSGFSEIEVRGAFGVVVRQSDRHRVGIQADDNVIEYIRVEQIGDRLLVAMDETRSYRNATMEAQIEMPLLTAVSVSGASRVVLEGFASERDLDIDLSGVSGLDGTISAGGVDMSLSGASRINLTGEAGDLRLRSSGSIRVDLSGFAVVNADIEASGASRIVVNASGKLTASASGASTVEYLGQPESVEPTTSGAAKIEPRL